METDQVLRGLGFEVVDHIGEGTFGKVKLATSNKYPNQVAIKIIDNKTSTDNSPDFLRREVDILRVVKHPHIVHVHEILERDGQVFIVMEPAATDLEGKIRKLHHIPIDQAKTWFSQLLRAMVYLHQQDIVHRDLKCANVLLTADDQVKLADFGIGRFYRSFDDLSQSFS
ncbi:testis-specific serine/threonine-protein kinase 6-like [Salminus brasiliensis]|uniref:testis-specific serine/threonine-protein kinase 6-like n=1 Tax=Salminus brasiliensis TaxID=930266 RepID=UPI003B82F06A